MRGLHKKQGRFSHAVDHLIENEEVKDDRDYEEEIENETSNPRQERRRKRQQAKAISELGDLPLPPPPGSPSLGDLPPPPGSPSLGNLPPPPAPSSLGIMDREVSCTSCSAVFSIRDTSLSSVNCPVCDERFGV